MWFDTMMAMGASGWLVPMGPIECRAMTTSSSQIRAQFDELKAGDHIEVEHRVSVGQNSWTAKTSGTVIRVERKRHGVHFHRHHDDKVFSDVVLLEQPDGELTSVTLDEFTAIRHV